MYKGLGQLGLVLVCQNLNQKTFVISQSDRSGRRGDPWIKFFIVEFIVDSGRHGSPKLKFQRVRSDSAVWLRYGSPKFRDVGVGSTR